MKKSNPREHSLLLKAFRAYLQFVNSGLYFKKEHVLAEETDVLSIVVSEETGIISVVKHGEIKRYMTMDKLKDEIEDVYGISMAAIARREEKKEKKHHGRFE